jgi:transcriptional regulator with XRE-family HTH domain
MDSYAKALGARLREIRQQQGWTLHAIERQSGGTWKAVVIGSYERGDRAITAQRLVELADFYGIPVLECLPTDHRHHGIESGMKVVLNLTRLRELPAHQVGPLARYAATIQTQRDNHNTDHNTDYDATTLSIRTEDLFSLAIIYEMNPAQLTAQLRAWDVLATDTDHTDTDHTDTDQG